MDYIFWGTIALKLGRELYDQMVDLLGDKIPTWPQLLAENAEFQAMIDAEN